MTIRKNIRTCGRRKYGAIQKNALLLPKSLIAPKEERVISPDRAAKSAAKVVTLQRRLLPANTCNAGTVEIIPRIQSFVAEIVEGIAVKSVRTGPGAHIHDRTRTPAVLRTEGRVIDLEFRGGIDRRLERDLVLAHVIQIHAIDLKVHRVFAVSGGNERARTEPAACARQTSSRRSNHATRSQHRKIKKVAAIQWNLLHRVAVDNLADRHRLGFDLRGSALHLNRLTGGSHSEGHIDRHALIDFKCHLLHRIQTEARCLGLHLVVARLQRRNNVDTCAIGCNLTIESGSKRMHRDLCPRNHSTAWIGDNTGQRCRGLREARANSHQQQHDKT